MRTSFFCGGVVSIWCCWVAGVGPAPWREESKYLVEDLDGVSGVRGTCLRRRLWVPASWQAESKCRVEDWDGSGRGAILGGTSKSSDQTSILGDLVGTFYSTHVVENRWVQKKFRPNHEFRRLSRNFLLFLTFRGLEQMLAGGQILPNFQKVPTKLCILTIWSELFTVPLCSLRIKCV